MIFWKPDRSTAPISGVLKSVCAHIDCDVSHIKVTCEHIKSNPVCDGLIPGQFTTIKAINDLPTKEQIEQLQKDIDLIKHHLGIRQ